MNTPCPHCSAVIEIDPATLASLAGQSHFACPACQGAVPVPAPARPRLQLNPAPGTQENAPTRAPGHSQAPTAASRSKNRNLLILGTTALLVLGGLAFMLASRKSGDTHLKTQNMRNEIINNSYFQNLIASGKTTEKDLNSIAEIRPYVGGFIGISKEKLDWIQAHELAKRTGAKILDPGVAGSSTRKQLTDLLTQSFPDLLGTTVWVIENDEPRVIDSPDVNPVTTLGRQRRVLLEWSSSGRTIASSNPAFLHFSGSEAVIVPNGNFFKEIEKNDQVTIEAWIRIGRLDKGFFPITDKYDTNQDFGWMFQIGAEDLQFVGGIGPTARAKWTAEPNTWEHVAVSYDRAKSRINFYVNGTVIGESIYSADIQETDEQPMYIGYGPSGGDEFSFGDIDEVRLWNRELSSNEISLNHNRSLKGDEQGLVCYLRFDEGEGQAPVDSSALQNQVRFSEARRPPSRKISGPTLSK